MERDRGPDNPNPSKHPDPSPRIVGSERGNLDIKRGRDLLAPKPENICRASDCMTESSVVVKEQGYELGPQQSALNKLAGGLVRAI